MFAQKVAALTKLDNMPINTQQIFASECESEQTV